MTVVHVRKSFVPLPFWFKRFVTPMKVKVKRWHAIAQWRWDIGAEHDDAEGEGDVCGICRVPYEGCCPSCKVPGDDCPLS